MTTTQGVTCSYEEIDSVLRGVKLSQWRGELGMTSSRQKEEGGRDKQRQRKTVERVCEACALEQKVPG